jgi:hypothetical protein
LIQLSHSCFYKKLGRGKNTLALPRPKSESTTLTPVKGYKNTVHRTAIIETIIKYAASVHTPSCARNQTMPLHGTLATNQGPYQIMVIDELPRTYIHSFFIICQTTLLK